MINISSFAEGFTVVFSTTGLLMVLVGCTLGMVVGILPGLGPATTIAILLPITFGLDAEHSLVMLAGIYYGAMYGGTLTAVLIKLPGEVASVVTIIDGHEMARQGRAGAALGIAAVGSFIGGVVATVVLLFLAAPMVAFASRFGPPELFLVGLLGLLMVASVSFGSSLKTVLMVAVGVLIASVGQDPISGASRLTGGSLDLLGGINVLAVAMGLFGIGEMLHLLSQGDAAPQMVGKPSRVLPTRTEFRQSLPAILRGTGIGCAGGLVPGAGTVTSSIGSYALERRVARDPSRFGKGAIEGVAGPESANNAAAVTQFLPLLTLGLPTGAVMALMYGALTLQGITPGPSLVTEHPAVFWGVIASMLIGNCVLLLMNIPLIGFFVRVIRTPISYISITAITVTFVGAYFLDNRMFDVWVALVSGIAGFLMRKVDLPPSPLVLAAILSPIIETSLRTSLVMSDGSWSIFLERPLSLALIASMVLVAAGPICFRGRNIIRQKTTIGNQRSSAP
jgi:putative tricarboxylic transport membrane protein